jgi:hypothetical protein
MTNEEIIGGVQSRTKECKQAYASRCSPWGTPQEWEAGFKRFWRGELNPKMKDIRRISPNNPSNFDLTIAIKGKIGRPKKKVDLEDEFYIMD